VRRAAGSVATTEIVVTIVDLPAVDSGTGAMGAWNERFHDSTDGVGREVEVTGSMIDAR
jgi:hypothetical protein